MSGFSQVPGFEVKQFEILLYMTPLSTSDAAVLLWAHAAPCLLCDSFRYMNTENLFTFVKINYAIIQINNTTNKLEFDNIP